MHELSVARSLLRAVEREAKREGFLKIKKVRVRMGIFSGIEVALLKKAFDYLKLEYDITANADLIIEEEGTIIVCRDCGEQKEINTLIFICSTCGSENVELNGGNSLEIISIVGCEPLRSMRESFQ